jgi:hypothetical protein
MLVAGYPSAMLRALAAAAVTMALLAVGASAAPSRVRGCNGKVDFNVVISSARNMSCRNAVLEIKRYHSSFKYRFTTPHHFRCRRVSGNPLGGQWRCVRRSKAFRVEFGD